MRIGDAIAECDEVAVRFEPTGAHGGRFGGIEPTAEPVEGAV